jgi:signal transduction histidine kinase
MPSTGDASDRGRQLAAAPLLTAVRQLAEREVFGLVWAGPDLIVDSTFGALARFVAIGEPLTDSVYALIGMEDDIRALKDFAGQAIELPDITLVMPESRRPRATLTISWSHDAAAFLLLIARTESRSELEIELTAQMRARFMAESELATKSRALERANDDLESYASVISHDLQSPMRVLRYTLDELELAAGPPSPEAQEKIGRLRELSQRMTKMLSALLDYASVTRMSDAIELVDTMALVHTVTSSIDVPPRIRLTMEGNWPRVRTMPAPLDLVLRNLIDNAVKHHDRTTGQVTVSAVPENNAIVLTVADDGPGISPEHRAAVFLPFRTLGTSNTGSGQGMGLALVRRSVESIGGSITLESGAPGERGTTFTVRWPVAPVPGSDR